MWIAILIILLIIIVYYLAMDGWQGPAIKLYYAKAEHKGLSAWGAAKNLAKADVAKRLEAESSAALGGVPAAPAVVVTTAVVTTPEAVTAGTAPTPAPVVEKFRTNLAHLYGAQTA
jgi:hypothetical protein